MGVYETLLFLHTVVIIVTRARFLLHPIALTAPTHRSYSYRSMPRRSVISDLI